VPTIGESATHGAELGLNYATEDLKEGLRRLTGGKGAELLDLSRPNLDFVALATGMGVPATRATTCEELAEQLGARVRRARSASDRSNPRAAALGTGREEREASRWSSIRLTSGSRPAS